MHSFCLLVSVEQIFDAAYCIHIVKHNLKSREDKIKGGGNNWLSGCSF